MIPERNISIN